jgi:hypothetical protein
LCDPMMTVEQATKALIAAIDAERQRLPRGASEAERKRLALCANAVSLINERRKRIGRLIDARSRFLP